MIKLLMIADDFTGALDSGVQCAIRGSHTLVTTDAAYDFWQAADDIEVLVMDAETRHLSPEEAYRTVFDVVRNAQEAGIQYIYKKTDSGLRGNIGSELAAVMDAARVEQIPFIPAFPKMNRITKNGVHYIDGTPVAESVFASDPFEPVLDSKVEAILDRQTKAPVVLRRLGDAAGAALAGIHVFDAETDDDLLQIGATLRREGLHISAGCAGFATVLADMLELCGKPPDIPRLEPALFVSCGSMNPVTLRQVQTAVEHGFFHIPLTPEQKIEPAWAQSPACGEAVEHWLTQIRAGGRCILDANDPVGSDATARYAAQRGLTTENLRVQIATSLGAMMKRLLDSGLRATMLCTGGDTLLALMRAVGVSGLTPVCEMDTGAVLSSFMYQGKTYHIISKSGGFGSSDLLCRLAALIEGREKEETVC